MASKSITKPAETAIRIPSLELPLLTDTLAELKAEIDKIPELEQQAKAIVCNSPASYAELVRIVDQIQDIGKLGEKKMRPYLDISNGVSEFLISQKKNQEQAAKLAAQPHIDRAATWKREEREAAQREQDRINEENRVRQAKIAEDQRKADEAAAVEKRKERVAEIRGMLKRGEIGKRKAEQLLREAGATEEADKAKAAADAEQTAANVGTATVLPNVPTVEGRRGGVEYYAEMVNGDQLVAAFSAAHNPYNAERVTYLRKFIMANESEVRKEAKEVKDSKKMASLIPGFKFTDKDRV